MKRCLIFLLLCGCLLLCACGAEPGETAGTAAPTLPSLSTAAPETTEAAPVYELTPGPALRFNGGDALETVRLEDAVLLAAEELAALGGGQAETETGSDGTPVLSLRLWDHSLRCRAEDAAAELDGEALELDRPAIVQEGKWYLPLRSAAAAFGCALYPREEGEELLLRPAAGQPLWFGGTPLGPCLLCGEVPYFRLSALTEALGGKFRDRVSAATAAVGEHRLRFYPGEPRFEADGEKLPLPLPALLLGGEWLVPVRPAAEALGLRELEDEAGLVFSAVEPRETKLFLDGAGTQAYGLPDGPLLLRLRDAAAALKGSLLSGQDGQELVWQAHSLTLKAGERVLLADGEELPLPVPVCADGSDWYCPASELLQALGLTELRDPELDQIYYTKIVRHEELPEGYSVPVFMYHAVSDAIWGIPELFVSPSRLEEQLKAIVEGGYTPITFEDLDRVAEIEKPVMLTFDDGYDDNYTELFPLLKKYNVKATIFVIVDSIGGRHKMTEAQIRELSDSGLVSIQSHTMSHNFLNEMYPDRLKHEHYDSMIALARLTGKQPFVLCYPTGKNSWASRQTTKEYYEYGLCMSGPCWVTGADPYLIYRYYVPRNLSLESFKAYLG